MSETAWTAELHFKKRLYALGGFRRRARACSPRRAPGPSKGRGSELDSSDCGAAV